jgi:lysyl-tRNA synthetase, class II
MAREADIRQVRLDKLRKLIDLGQNPYPARIPRTHSALEVKIKFAELEKSETTISVAGRIMALRGQGAILFAVVTDGTDTIQCVLKKDTLADEKFASFTDLIDIGDFVSFTGTAFTTQRGEQSILVTDWQIVTKALLPLPEKWHGIQDPDERYRKRYLDLLMTPELRELFAKKAHFWEATRHFLKNQGFTEVETPTLEVTTGGAEATPFKTHHNDFDLDVYLRISVGELWQKRLMAAGFPKTFEIGRVYRNEGSSPEHLQEFTNMEFYWAYASYEDGMALTQKMYQTIAQEVFGTTKFTTRGHTFDLAGEWPHIRYTDEIKKTTGIDVLTATEDEMKQKLEELKVSYEGQNRERLTDTLWKYCRKKISGPAFLIDHPKLVSPLAKAKENNAELTERFQIILAGSEVGNGWSELNDPLDQRARFELQQKLIESGDTEAMMPEWEFVEMLEHGMPPTCGFGFGDRFFAFLVDKPIREVQLFPLMRPKNAPVGRQDMQLATIVVNTDANLEPWQIMNTASHLSAAFGARAHNHSLFAYPSVATKDGVSLPLNIRHAIMVRSGGAEGVKRLIAQAKEQGIHLETFTREMLETTNDKKVREATAGKNFDDVEILGVLLFGNKKDVEALTASLPLYK